MATYLSSTFPIAFGEPDLNVHTPAIGSIFVRSSHTPNDGLFVTSEKVRAATPNDGPAIYYSTTETALDIDILFDVTIVTNNVSGAMIGAVARWEDTNGVGFKCYLEQTGTTTADLVLVAHDEQTSNTELAREAVAVSASSTYNVKWTIRSSGGSTTHNAYWDDSPLPLFTYGPSSSGPQVAGKTGLTGSKSLSSTGYHLDNLVAADTPLTAPIFIITQGYLATVRVPYFMLTQGYDTGSLDTSGFTPSAAALLMMF